MDNKGSSVNNIEESKLIVLNSKDADLLNGDFLSHVRFNFRDVLKKESDIYYVGVSLMSAEIPCSFYNINVNNNTLTYSVNAVDYTMEVAEGNYTATSFIAEFVSQFVAGGHGETIAITFNKITGKLTTTKTGGTYDVVYTGGSSYEVLGFLEGVEYTIATTLVHPYMLNMLGVKKLKILSPSLSVASYDSAGHTNGSLIHTISVDMPSYSLINYSNNTTAVSRVNNRTINDIEILILDENHNYVDFNNVYWDMTLMLKIFRKIRDPMDDNLNTAVIPMTMEFNEENNPMPTKTEIREIYSDMDKENLEQLELLLM